MTDLPTISTGCLLRTAVAEVRSGSHCFVSVFGGEAVHKELQLTSIVIQTKNGRKSPISVMVVPKIAAPIQNLVPTRGDRYLYLHGLPLAHPVGKDNKFEISLLIGAHFCWNTVKGTLQWYGSRLSASKHYITSTKQ